MEDSSNCQICGIIKSKYSCPKCHITYCSALCYQSSEHLQCSEVFYEQCVREELKSCQSDPRAKKRTLEILKKTQDTKEEYLEEYLDSDDEEAIPDLASRMIDVNLDDEETVWGRLTVEEQREFWKLVASGDIMKILPDWEPWWKIKKKKALISDVNESCDWKSECPAIPSEIPELSKLTTVDPSPYMPYILLNVLMSYVYTVRWFKGAHNSLPLESTSTCIALSAVLRSGQVFKNVLEAFRSFEEDLSECKWVKEDYNRDLMQGDLIDIINGSDENDLFFCVKAVICDLNLLFSQTLDMLTNNKTNHLKRFSGSPPRVSLLQQVSRKMTYYLSWTLSHGNSLLDIF